MIYLPTRKTLKNNKATKRKAVICETFCLTCSYTYTHIHNNVLTLFTRCKLTTNLTLH